MGPELEQKLFNSYPKLYSKRTDPKESLMCFGFECGDGWYNLINCLSYQLEKLGVEAVQVKEKFGGLRFYIKNGNDVASALIDLAENISFTTCERCGCPGEKRIGGWILTLCNSCNEKVSL